MKLLSAHAIVLGEVDDTYLLIKPNQAATVLEAVAPAFAPSGTQVNVVKSCIWCPSPVNVGTSGFIQVPDIPAVLKQPLLTIDAEGNLAFGTVGLVKFIDNRQQMFERLGKLRNAGLPLQTALVLARFATSGDAVYASQCQLIPQEIANQIDLLTLEMVLVGAGQARQRFAMNACVCSCLFS